MSVDFQRDNINSENIGTNVLRSISSTLESMEKEINSFHLVDNDVYFDDNQIESKVINDELSILIPEENLLASTTLNH